MSGRWIEPGEKSFLSYLSKRRRGCWCRVVIREDRVFPDEEGEWVVFQADPERRKFYIIPFHVYEGLQRLDAIRQREKIVHLHKAAQLDEEYEATVRMVIGREFFEEAVL